MLQDMEVVVPELVFDEESHHGTHGTQEAAGIGDGIEWQIGDDVGTVVVLAHLVARRREERQQSLILRMFTAQLLPDGAPLLELAE